MRACACRYVWKIIYLPAANVVSEGYVFTSVCLSMGGGVLSQHALQVSRPTAKGEVEGDLVQAHIQGGS